MTSDGSYLPEKKHQSILKEIKAKQSRNTSLITSIICESMSRIALICLITVLKLFLAFQSYGTMHQVHLSQIHPLQFHTGFLLREAPGEEVNAQMPLQ